MRVTCPHCSAAYNVDDGRIPEGGSNVRCPKCQQSFPVRRGGGEAASTAVPLPAPPSFTPPPTAAAPPSPARIATPAGVPLPAPPRLVNPPPARVTPPGSPAAVPLPAPGPFDSPPVGATEPPWPPEPAAEGGSPFAPSDAAFATADSPFATVGSPFAAAVEAPRPVTLAPAAPREPLPVPSEPLGFGEVDFDEPAEVRAAPADPSPVPAPREDPFAPLDLAPPPTPPAVPPPPAPPPRAADGADLEPLFGEPARGAPSRAAAEAGGYKVRRRSGKVFGPFEAEQIVAMVTKGELLGNEDISSDGGGVWEPIGSVPKFAEAMRTLTATPDELGGGPARRAAALSGVPFGDRMAASKITGEVAAASSRPRWFKAAIAAGAVLVVLGAGSAGLLTRHGFFFHKALRGSGEKARVAQLAAQARDLLSRDDLVSDQAALVSAEQALQADDREAGAAALQAVAVAALDRRHAALAPALQQARTLAAALLSREPEDPATALAALAIATLDDGPALAAAEAAAEKVTGGPTPDGLHLLGEAAMLRGDAARAAGHFQRLEAAQPTTVRAARAQGRAAAARGDVAGARGWFEKALARSPGHLPTVLEQASLAEAVGDLEAAGQGLEVLLAKEAETRLGPGERARALGIRAALLGRRAATAAAAGEAYQAALTLDARQPGLRLALARLRLKRGDPVAAVAALEPLAGSAAGDPAVAELRVRALAEAGRVLDASQLAEAALARSPGNPQLLAAKGMVLEAQAKPAEARKLYQEAAAKAPGDVALRVALGRLALDEKDLPAAEASLAVAVEKGPRDPAAQSALGDLKAAQGDAAGAVAAYRAALELEPEYASAELGLAQLALARGDETEAQARLEKVLTLEPRNARAQAALGSLRWKAGDLEGAEKSFASAAQLAPKNALVQIRLGAVKLLRSDVPGALEALTTGTGLDPNIAEGQHWLGRALLAKGEIPAAMARLRRSVEQEPGNAVYLLHLGIALERTNAPTEAAETYKEAAAAAPKFTEPVERLGLLYAGHGNCKLAIPCFEKALAIAPKVARFKVELADCRLKDRKGAEAIKLYREVTKADPAEVSVPYKLARALHETQGAAAALPWYEKAAAVEKANPMPHYYLGYAYKEKGARARAANEFKAYLALKPDAEDSDDIRREIEDLGGTP